MLTVWKERPPAKDCQMQGNDHGGAQGGPQVSPVIVPENANFNLITVAVMRTNSAVVTGLLGGEFPWK